MPLDLADFGDERFPIPGFELGLPFHPDRRVVALECLIKAALLAGPWRKNRVGLIIERPPDPGKELPGLRKALAAALRAFLRERGREGRHVQRDMRQRAATLAALAGRIRHHLPELQRALRRRMEERVTRLAAGVDVDPGRLAQELASLADRGDVTEELVRLESHLAALATALRGRAPAGKQVEFLLQEILRELNTTGAKAADVRTSAWVLEAKGEVEKLREQVQNVE